MGLEKSLKNALAKLDDSFNLLLKTLAINILKRLKITYFNFLLREYCSVGTDILSEIFSCPLLTI